MDSSVSGDRLTDKLLLSCRNVGAQRDLITTRIKESHPAVIEPGCIDPRHTRFIGKKVQKSVGCSGRVLIALLIELIDCQQ